MKNTKSILYFVFPQRICAYVFPAGCLHAFRCSLSCLIMCKMCTSYSAHMYNCSVAFNINSNPEMTYEANRHEKKKRKKQGEKKAEFASFPPPHCTTITALQTESWVVLIWALHIHRQSAERCQLHRVLKCLIETLQSEYVILIQGWRQYAQLQPAAYSSRDVWC